MLSQQKQNALWYQWGYLICWLLGKTEVVGFLTSVFFANSSRVCCNIAMLFRCRTPCCGSTVCRTLMYPHWWAWHLGEKRKPLKLPFFPCLSLLISPHFFHSFQCHFLHSFPFNNFVVCHLDADEYSVCIPGYLVAIPWCDQKVWCEEVVNKIGRKNMENEWV